MKNFLAAALVAVSLVACNSTPPPQPVTYEMPEALMLPCYVNNQVVPCAPQDVQTPQQTQQFAPVMAQTPQVNNYYGNSGGLFGGNDNSFFTDMLVYHMLFAPSYGGYGGGYGYHSYGYRSYNTTVNHYHYNSTPSASPSRWSGFFGGNKSSGVASMSNSRTVTQSSSSSTSSYRSTPSTPSRNYSYSSSSSRSSFSSSSSRRR